METGSWDPVREFLPSVGWSVDPRKWPPLVPVAFYVTDVALELECSVPVYFNYVSY